ncbi:MAG: hypothetical protein OXU36_04525 [Candidatus Poribacteria bacterium]|nr:hypothetical protein [Candidatus Poribacteria bacterium]
MSYLPKIERPALPERIPIAKKLEGKTIAEVKYGHREHTTDVHESEVLILEFTDGTKLGLTIGSNARELKGRQIKPEDFLADFIFDWDDE